MPSTPPFYGNKSTMSSAKELASDKTEQGIHGRGVCERACGHVSHQIVSTWMLR